MRYQIYLVDSYFRDHRKRMDFVDWPVLNGIANLKQKCPHNIA